MARQGAFDELMIVNPSQQGEKYMKFYPVDRAALSGYIAEAPESLGCCDRCSGYRVVQRAACGVCGSPLAEAPELAGYMAEDPNMMGYGENSEMGYFADPPPGFVEGYIAQLPEGYGEYAPEMGYFAESPEYVGEAPETMGYFAESPEYVSEVPEMGYFAESPEYVSEVPEMGYFAESPEYVSEAPEMGYFAENPEVGYVAEDPYGMQGYVRESEGFNPRVAPIENISGFGGYTRPRTINPTAEVIRPAEEVSQPSGQWFRPHF